VTLYLAMAHAALLLAFATVAFDPRGVTGFFYHARMLAVVHLVTIGWLTASILGSLYLVGPIALRMPLAARRSDYIAAALVAIGLIGMVAHFWIAEYGGMAWSGGTVAAGVLLVGWRVAGPLARAPIHPAVRLHVRLAFLNLLAAATMGVLIGVHKVRPFLPGFLLDHVFAHAHLAAIGWASMLVVGIAYRLLPMVLPAQMPDGPRLYVTAALLEIGAGGIFVTLILHARLASIFALVTVAGFAAFAAQGIWMLRHPRPRPPAIRGPDPAVLHAAASLVSLAIACGLGVWVSLSPPSGAMLAAATAYGVFGLVGFLAQMVVAMKGRLLPLLAWYWAFANSGHRMPVPSPHAMVWRPAQYAVFGLWVAGLPALAGGLAFNASAVVQYAAVLLLVATVLDTGQTVAILRHAYTKG